MPNRCLLLQAVSLTWAKHRFPSDKGELTTKPGRKASLEITVLTSMVRVYFWCSQTKADTCTLKANDFQGLAWAMLIIPLPNLFIFSFKLLLPSINDLFWWSGPTSCLHTVFSSYMWKMGDPQFLPNSLSNAHPPRYCGFHFYLCVLPPLHHYAAGHHSSPKSPCVDYILFMFVEYPPHRHSSLLRARTIACVLFTFVSVAPSAAPGPPQKFNTICRKKLPWWSFWSNV